MPEEIIRIQNVTKTFKVPHERRHTLKEHFVNIFRRRSYEKFQALQGVSFTVQKGEFLGIIGRNGSGKSTLLKVIAGILKPNAGQVIVNGTIAPFLELGVGFQGDLSARDNVYLYGAILGLSRQAIDRKFESIIKFAELENFIDQKLKNFSSGMQVRLAFATAIQAEADILLVDEVLAVGDLAFQKKCREIFLKLKGAGKTVIFVSHDIDSIKQFCTQVVLINQGKIVEYGRTEKVVDDYFNFLRKTVSEKISSDSSVGRLENKATRAVVINDAWIADASGKKIQVAQSGQDIAVKFTVKFYQPVEQPIFGITLRNLQGEDIFVTNTFWQGLPTGSFSAGDEKTVEFWFKNELPGGRYFISPAIASSDREKFYDWRDEYLEFYSHSKITTGGKVDFCHKIRIY